MAKLRKVDSEFLLDGRRVHREHVAASETDRAPNIVYRIIHNRHGCVDPRA